VTEPALLIGEIERVTDAVSWGQGQCATDLRSVHAVVRFGHPADGFLEQRADHRGTRSSEDRGSAVDVLEQLVGESHDDPVTYCGTTRSWPACWGGGLRHGSNIQRR
jgi:hypothetical protein